MPKYLGNARVVQSSAGSTRSFALRSDQGVDGVGAGDMALHTLPAGGSINLYYRTDTSGITPPAPANTVILRVYYETGTGTLVRELHNGSPPSNGALFTFHATSDGTATGSPRAGTLRLYVQAIRTDIGTYNINSDANGDSGGIVAHIKASALAVSAYPAGSMFAFGAAADESLTLTATHTQPFAVRGHEHVRLNVLDALTQQVVGPEQDIGSGTATSRAFTVNADFDPGLKTYGAELVPTGVALWAPDSNPSMLWTQILADAPSVTQNGSGVYRTAFYDVNPDYSLINLSLGQSIYNRLESATHSFELLNARSEQLTRTVTWNLLDSAAAVMASVSSAGPVYTNTRQILGTETATPDLIGDTWSLVTTLSNTYNVSTNIYAVSRKKLIKETAVAPDGTVFTGKTASPTADDKVIFNRGQPLYFATLIYNVRGELLAGESGFFAPRRADQEIYEVGAQATTLGAGGELSGSYTVPLSSVTTPPGRALVYTDVNVQQPRSGSGGNGNFAETDLTTPEWTITNQYTLQVKTQKAPTYNEDPADTIFTIGDDAIYTFCQVIDAHGDVVSNAAVDYDQIDPNSVVSDEKAAVTGANGWTNAVVFQPNTPKGQWVIQGDVFNHNGNVGTGTQTLEHVSAFSANKTIVTGFGPANNVPNSVAGRQTAQPGDLAKPGDRLLVGLTMVVQGFREPFSAAPVFQVARFNQVTSKIESLQADYTWKALGDAGFTEHFFDYKVPLEGGLEWIASFGTAAQGVTATNGYVVDTATWPPGNVFIVVSGILAGQRFDTGRSFPFVGAGSMHPMDAGDMPESLITFDRVNGHRHDGVNSKASFRRFGPTGIFE